MIKSGQMMTKATEKKIAVSGFCGLKQTFLVVLYLISPFVNRNNSTPNITQAEGRAG